MSVAGDNGNTGVAMGTKAMLEALAREADAVVERLRRSVVAIRSPVSGGGSGIIWQDDGLVITNSHVVRGERAEIQTWDGRVLPARLVARDPEFDLAALRVNAAGLPATVVGDSRAVRTGQIVLAVGHPWGERWSVTAGIVLGVGEAVPTPPVPLPESIRADLRLAPGNSGGPLADAEGRVIGGCGLDITHLEWREGEIGYHLHPAYWGQGYATEAARALVGFGFEHLKLHRIVADCLAENPASARVMQKAGMQQEAHFRQNQWMAGRWQDTLAYAILASEWQRA